MKQYHKIPNVFKRDPDTKKLIEGSFQDETIQYLQDLIWVFTEKIDGTNIRIGWDGHKVQIKGRKENSNIPLNLYKRLQELFEGEDTEELFEQRFGELPVTLFGEGYGHKIQKNGSKYVDGKEEVDFILFDVQIGDKFLSREQVNEIARYFNIKRVSRVLFGTIRSGVEYVKTHSQSELNPNAPLEGLVGVPSVELRDKNGERIVVKIKRRDYQTGE